VPQNVSRLDTQPSMYAPRSEEGARRHSLRVSRK
jgi:hypothetical protein